jgi:hypothetical protein
MRKKVRTASGSSFYPFEGKNMRLMSRAIAASAGVGLLLLAACTVNTAPPPPPVQPAPVVVQPPPPSGSVVVQPRAY